MHGGAERGRERRNRMETDQCALRLARAFSGPSQCRRYKKALKLDRPSRSKILHEPTVWGLIERLLLLWRDDFQDVLGLLLGGGAQVAPDEFAVFEEKCLALGKSYRFWNSEGIDDFRVIVGE